MHKPQMTLGNKENITSTQKRDKRKKMDRKRKPGLLQNEVLLWAFHSPTSCAVFTF